MGITAPIYDVDYYSDDFIVEPYPHYKNMRDLGSVVWLPQHGNFAVTRYEAVKHALKNYTAFSSAQGVAADDAGCQLMRGNTVASDPPVHDEMRRAMGAPLLPGALRDVKARVEQCAEQLICTLIERRKFDGMTDLARHIPETVVTDLVGLPEDGRENMGDWAAAAFDMLGIQNARGKAGVECIKEMRTWVTTQATPERLKSGSWTKRILELAENGSLATELSPMLIRDYINPSLDTTISATGQLIYELGKNPDQWDILKNDPTLIPNAVDEAVRLSTPIRSFCRQLTTDYELAGYDLPTASRIMVIFASANRDEREFSNPDQFDVTRERNTHLGFGHGIHMCVGMHLARLEMESLLQAMIGKVQRIIVGTPTVALNNTIRSFASFAVELVPTANARVQNSPPTFSGDSRKESHWIPVSVIGRNDEARDIISLKLTGTSTGALPVFCAGSHIDLELEPGLIRQYSICSDPSDRSHYRIAVLKDTQSRGGSIAVHERIRAGETIRISKPRNNFKLNEAAKYSLLLAGGIGITPLLAMAYRLSALGRNFDFHYCAKSRERCAFLGEIDRAKFAQQVIVHFDDGPAEQKIDLSGVISKVNGDAHVYVCGPRGFIDNALSYCRPQIPETNIHVEHFGAEIDLDHEPFTVYAKRSDKLIQVQPGETILVAMEKVGIAVAKACESGVCGTCVTRVLSGTPEHHDMVLTDEEKAENTQIAVCCSTSKSRRLDLDI